MTPLEDGQRTLHDGAVQEGLEYNIIYPSLFYLKFFKIPIYTHTYLWIKAFDKTGFSGASSRLLRLSGACGVYKAYSYNTANHVETLELG